MDYFQKSLWFKIHICLKIRINITVVDYNLQPSLIFLHKVKFGGIIFLLFPLFNFSCPFSFLLCGMMCSIIESKVNYLFMIAKHFTSYKKCWSKLLSTWCDNGWSVLTYSVTECQKQDIKRREWNKNYWLWVKYILTNISETCLIGLWN